MRRPASRKTQGTALHGGFAMITKNPMQLKAFIKNKAAEKHISAQLVMQNYMHCTVQSAIKQRYVVP